MSTLLLIALVVLVVVTPALVGDVVFRAAARATGPGGESIPSLAGPRRLRLATLAALLLFGAWAVLDPSILSEARRAALGVAELAAFVVLGLLFLFPALHEATTAARDLVRSETDRAAVRTASLRPRRVADYVSLRMLLVPYGVAIVTAALLALRLAASPAGDRRPLLCLGFAAASFVFAGLYGAWIHEEACGPESSGVAGTGGEPAREEERRRRVRAVFLGQAALVTVLGGLALVLVDVDWSVATGRTVALAGASLGGLVGVLGCAASIASDVSRRRLETALRKVAR
jgi:hypothetical protein